MVTNQERGNKGEALAVEYLKAQGFIILIKNHRSRFGEIDIIAQEEDVLSFIEVKTRETDQCGDPLEAVTPRKQRTIIRMAQEYLQENDIDDQQVRFDVAAVYGSVNPKIELIRDAFGQNY